MQRLAVAATCTFLLLALGCGNDNGAPGGTDGGATTIDGSVATIDAAPGAPDAETAMAPDADTTTSPDGSVGITCGQMTCTGNKECCVTQGAGGGNPSFACVNPGSCQGASVACDGPEDCSGKACCGMFGGTTASTSCANGATCQGAQTVQFCHNDADCPSMAGGPKCCPNTFTGSGGFCLGVGIVQGACPQ
jgi:hypothetical protein